MKEKLLTLGYVALAPFMLILLLVLLVLIFAWDALIAFDRWWRDTSKPRSDRGF